MNRPTTTITRAIGWGLGLLLVPFAAVFVRVVHGDTAQLYDWED